MVYLRAASQEQEQGKVWSEAEAILFDAQWADPVEQPGISRSSRGSVVINFGPDVTETWLKTIDCIIPIIFNIPGALMTYGLECP